MAKDDAIIWPVDGNIIRPAIDYLRPLHKIFQKSGAKLFDRAEKSPAESDLFDLEFYSAQVGTEFQSRTQALTHFLDGAAPHTVPHPVLDPGFVAAQLGVGSLSAQAAWRAVIDSARAPYISPHRLFEPELYLRNLPSAARKLAERAGNPVLHFLNRWHEHRTPFSRYFDPAFYFANTPGVAVRKTNPLDHYVRQAPESLADANPLFHAGYYRKTYGRTGADMLADFLAVGHARLYLPNPWALQELQEKPLTPKALLSYIEL